MPKKKLTKAQVKRKIKIILNNTSTLFFDKVSYPRRSEVPFSMEKLLQLEKTIHSATKRMK